MKSLPSEMNAFSYMLTTWFYCVFSMAGDSLLSADFSEGSVTPKI